MDWLVLAEMAEYHRIDGVETILYSRDAVWHSGSIKFLFYDREWWRK